MNLIKLLIPKNKAQSVTEVESYTVKWQIKEGWSGTTLEYFKVFINLTEAKEFKEQLEESAKFIKCWIEVEMYKN